VKKLKVVRRKRNANFVWQKAAFTVVNFWPFFFTLKAVRV